MSASGIAANADHARDVAGLLDPAVVFGDHRGHDDDEEQLRRLRWLEEPDARDLQPRGRTRDRGAQTGDARRDDEQPQRDHERSRPRLELLVVEHPQEGQREQPDGDADEVALHQGVVRRHRRGGRPHHERAECDEGGRREQRAGVHAVREPRLKARPHPLPRQVCRVDCPVAHAEQLAQDLPGGRAGDRTAVPALLDHDGDRVARLVRRRVAGEDRDSRPCP